VVLEEAPLLVATALSSLPPLEVFARVEGVQVRMPTELSAIGGQGWPRQSVFDNKHLGLLLAFADAEPAVKCRVFAAMQHTIEAGGDAPTGTTDGLPAESAAAACCTAAAKVLRSRAGPWGVNNWDVPEELLAVWEEVEASGSPAAGDAGSGAEVQASTKSSGGGLVGALLRIFTVNAHAYGGDAALFDVATKLAHSCHLPLVTYQPDVAAGVGRFVAARDIPKPGTLLTTSYLGAKLGQTSTPQRRRILYCQKGFICRCQSCERKPDLYRRVRGMVWTPGGGGGESADGNIGRWVGGAGDEQLVSTQLEQEQRLAAKATRIYFGYDLVMGRKMQPEQALELEQLLAECTHVSGVLLVSLLSAMGPTVGWCS
jgi:hypothetical protein